MDQDAPGAFGNNSGELLRTLKKCLSTIEGCLNDVISQGRNEASDFHAAKTAIDQANKTLDEYTRHPSEAYFSTFPERNPNPVLEISLGGHLEYLNPAARQLFPDLEDQQTSHPFLAGWEQVAGKFHNQPDLNLIREVEVRGVYYQQSIFFIDEFQRLRVYGTDITERKKREAEREQLILQLEEQRRIAESMASQAQQRADELDATFAALAEAVIIYDANGKALRANPAAIKALGFDPMRTDITGLVGKLSTRDPDGRPVEPAGTPSARALAGQEVIGESFILKNAEGRDSHIIASASPLWGNGQVVGAVATWVDITERMQAELLDKALNGINEIIHAHLSFDQIMQGALYEAAKALVCDSAAISLRKGGKWIASYVYGLSQDVIGAQMNDDEERHAVLAIQTKKPVAVPDAFQDERFNREHLRKWGIRSVLVVPVLLKGEAIGALFFNYQQAIFEFQSMHINFGMQLASSISLALENASLIENLKEELSKRKKAEKALVKANASLEQRVRERTAELERSSEKLQRAYEEIKRAGEELSVQNEELETAEEELRNQNEQLVDALAKEKSLRLQLIQAEKYAALARLLGSVAHEINNPLQTVRNSLFLLQREISSPELQEILDMASSETKRISALVTQLRETYKPASTKPVDFNLIEMLERVHGLLGPQLRQSNVQWKLLHKEDAIISCGIPDQIQQVCLNICLNAIDAMAPNGGKLYVYVTPLFQHHRVSLTFRDTGPGIPEEHLTRIFEPFFTTKTKGTGLGLSICYEIVKEHGGNIMVENLPGKGAKFRVWLPIK